MMQVEILEMIRFKVGKAGSTVAGWSGQNDSEGRFKQDCTPFWCRLQRKHQRKLEHSVTSTCHVPPCW